MAKADRLISGMPNVLLALHVLCEAARGADSFWAPYLAILPSSFTTPLFASPEDLEHLYGSPVHQQVIE